MMREVLAAGASITPALGALIFFMSFFFVAVAWTYRRGAQQTYLQASWMPLEGGPASAEEGHRGESR